MARSCAGENAAHPHSRRLHPSETRPRIRAAAPPSIGVAPRDCEGVSASFAPYPVSGAAHSSGGLTSWRPGRNESASHRLGWIECKICSAFRAERPPGSASRNFSDARVRAQPVGLSPGKLLLPWRLRSVPCFGIAFVGGAGSRGGVCVRAAAPRSGSTVLTCACGVALLRSTVRDVWKSLQLQPGNLRLLRGLPAHVRLDLRRSRLHAW